MLINIVSTDKWYIIDYFCVVMERFLFKPKRNLPTMYVNKNIRKMQKIDKEDWGENIKYNERFMGLK